jgi:hypothetical protein
LSIMPMQSSMAMLDIPATMFVVALRLPAIGRAQPGTAPLKSIPSATRHAAIRCTRRRLTMWRIIGPGTSFFKDGTAG